MTADGTGQAGQTGPGADAAASRAADLAADEALTAAAVRLALQVRPVAPSAAPIAEPIVVAQPLPPAAPDGQPAPPVPPVVLAKPDDGAPETAHPSPPQGAATAGPVVAMVPPPPVPDRAPLVKPRMRRRHRPTYRAILAIVLLPFAFAIIAAVGLIGQDITAPSWLKSRVEAQAAAVLQGGALRFGAITVTVARDLHPTVRLTDTVLTDASGATIARVPEIALGLSPRGLILRREVLPQTITLTGAALSVNRNADGQVALSFGETSAGQADSFAALLEGFDTIFDQPGLAALETVSAQGLIVNYQDARARRGWTVDGGTLALDLTGGMTRLSGALTLLGGRSYVTGLQLAYESPRGSRAAELALTVTDAAAADIATQAPLISWLSVLDAPLSATMRMQIDTAGNLTGFRASMKLGEGALAPVAGVPPVRFDYVRADAEWDPVSGRIGFDRVAVLSDWGGIRAGGQAFLTDVVDGWPGGFVGQFDLTDISLDPPGLYAQPLEFAGASVDLRLSLRPFALTIGQFALIGADGAGMDPLTGRAQIGAAPEGWSVAVDVQTAALTRDRAMAMWPESMKPDTRWWFENYVPEGVVTDLRAGLRVAPGQPMRLAISNEFTGLDFQPLRRLPPITGAAGHASYDNGQLSLTLEAGRIAPPQGGTLDLAGSTIVIPNVNIPNPPATVRLESTGSVTGTLALIDMPPFGYVSAAELPVTVADGRAQVSARVDLPLMDQAPSDQIDFAITARLTDVSSTILVPGRALSAGALTAEITPDGMTIGGAVRIGRVPADLTWRQDFAATSQPSRVTGTIELSERFLEEFAIGLPSGALRGEGRADVTMVLARDAAPTFTLQSDLRGVALSLPALGWGKGTGSGGDLRVEGRLGDAPAIDRLAIDAGGLQADGSIRLTADGGLDRASFDRVRLDGWLDAPVDLVGRGPDRAAQVVIGGGSLDLRRADAGEDAGDGGPMTVRLDRMQVTDGIALTDFQGNFDGAGGMAGDFTAQVNGGAAVQGTVVPQNGRMAVRITAADAGQVLRSAGMLQNAQGGAMDMTLLPAGGEGSYDGRLDITALRVRDAPALASLLNAVSVIGLLQQMAGQGLVFDEVQADFRISPDRIVVGRSSAVGVGLGISLDGTYLTGSGEMDFQGVVSPFFLINGIGSILTRPGEGLLGMNFRLRGLIGAPRVTVNPFSILTPGMFREIFRRPPPDLTQ